MLGQNKAPAPEAQSEEGAARENQAAPIVPQSVGQVKVRLDALIKAYLYFKEKKAEAVEPWDTEMRSIKAEIEHALGLLPEPNHKSDAGHAYIQERTTVKYNAKHLDAVCASFPEVKERIWPHRTEKTSKSLTVR